MPPTRPCVVASPGRGRRSGPSPFGGEPLAACTTSPHSFPAATWGARSIGISTPGIVVEAPGIVVEWTVMVVERTAIVVEWTAIVVEWTVIVVESPAGRQHRTTATVVILGAVC
jgi:hypothetical protein